MPKPYKDSYEYEKMPRKALIAHCRAYALAIHKLSNECMRHRLRFQMLERTRTALHGSGPRPGPEGMNCGYCRALYNPKGEPEHIHQCSDGGKGMREALS